MRLTRPLAVLGLACLIVFAPACVSADLADIKAQSGGNPKVSLKGYTTYAWAAAGSVINDPDMRWTAPDLNIGDEIIAAANQQMQAKGLVETSMAPDLLVFFGVGIDMKALKLTEVDGIESFKETPQGGILIVLADAPSGAPIWAGSAEGELHEDVSRELARKRIRYGVKKIFERLER